MQFAELNLRYTSPENTTNMVKRALRMGYDTIVINIEVADFGGCVSMDDMLEDAQPPTRKKKKLENANPIEEHIPNPFLVDESLLDLSNLENSGKKFRQFR